MIYIKGRLEWDSGCVCLRLQNCRKMTDEIADMEKRQETLVFVCMCSVSWLLPVKLSVLAKWLARNIHPRTPNRGEGIVPRKHRPKTVDDYLGLVYCFIVYYVFVLSPALCNIFNTPMTRYSLFGLKMPLYKNQPTNQKSDRSWLSAVVTRRLIARFCRFFQLRYLTVVFRCPAFVISELLLLLTRRRASRVAVDDRLRRARAYCHGNVVAMRRQNSLQQAPHADRPTDRTNERMRAISDRAAGRTPSPANSWRRRDRRDDHPSTRRS